LFVPIAGVTDVIDASRIGVFNNSATTPDGNGAPAEGIAIFGVSQTSGLLYQWVFWPGIAGTTHFTVDDPANRQHLLGTPFDQDELLDTIGPDGRAHIRFVFGYSVDDAPFAASAFQVNVTAIPESSTLVLLALGGLIVSTIGIRSRRRVAFRDTLPTTIRAPSDPESSPRKRGQEPSDPYGLYQGA
jgi:hypothetical protein